MSDSTNTASTLLGGLLRWVGGPLLTLGLAIIVELLSHTAFFIPNPPAILLLAVVFSAFSGGLGPGLISAVIAWLYFAYYFSIPGQPMHYTDENLHRILVWAITTPTMVLLVAVLQRRAQRQKEKSERLIREVTEKEATLTAERKTAAERERLLRQVEQSAQVAQRRAAELEGVLDNMIDGVFVCDVEGRIILTNDAGVRLLGLASIEEVKRALEEFPEFLRIRHTDGSPVAYEDLPLARALAGEIVVQEDEIIYIQRTQRDTYVRTSAAPIKDEKGKIVGAVEVARDVTELSELDRLKDQFISVAAHELKTPVAIMKGYAQALLRTAEEIPPAGRKMLEAIDRGSDRIDRLVKDLLDISRLSAGRLELTAERIDLLEMVEEVVNRMALTTTKHRIRVVRAEPVRVKGDRDRLEQVVVNLLDNAIRYSPKGGDVDVEVDVRDREAVVSVRDYGVGIPKEKQAHIFERFYRAHTGTPYDYGGMGVGLYISREIISRHGGTMWFESEEGKGSIFYFSLPLQKRTI